MEKLYTSKTTLKMAGRGCIPLILPLDPSLALSYRNHQKSMAYFSYLAQLILFLFTKRQSQKGGGAWLNAPLNTLPVLVVLRMLKGILH